MTPISAATLVLLAVVIVTPAQAAGVRAPTEKVIYSFQGVVASDGAYPVSSLINIGGTLYGMTNIGGASDYGTIFKLTTAGAETVLYSFQGVVASDGAYPEGSLLNVGGMLYGLTGNGGAYQVGTVFSATLGGTETVVHSFRGIDGIGHVDGAFPSAGLTNVGGTLYGTAGGGGELGGGTVFKVTSAGTEKTIYAAGTNGGSIDASAYSSDLLHVLGTLYGTSYYGGQYGYGAVFTVQPNGTESVVYSFKGSGAGDGAYPWAGLVDVGGTLYGTTIYGGLYGYGTVFKITPSGAESVVYSFGGPGVGDGAFPWAGLIGVGGTLYGTTEQGGANGYGTVFSVTPAGTETVLYSFQGAAGSDGAYPYGSLLNVSGTLYGTTEQGGASGYGTVFAVKP
jgi:uncharacterized repeat protein (TIGR03803 family)